MTQESKEAKAKRVIAKMKKDRGYLYPEQELLANLDPDFAEAYAELSGRLFLSESEPHDTALDLKTRELIPIVILAYRGLPDMVYVHMKRAMRCGATKQELLEALEMTVSPGGAVCLNMGLTALLRIEEEEQAQAGKGKA